MRCENCGGLGHAAWYCSRGTSGAPAPRRSPLSAPSQTVGPVNTEAGGAPESGGGIDQRRSAMSAGMPAPATKIDRREYQRKLQKRRQRLALMKAERKGKA